MKSAFDDDRNKPLLGNEILDLPAGKPGTAGWNHTRVEGKTICFYTCPVCKGSGVLGPPRSQYGCFCDECCGSGRMMKRWRWEVPEIGGLPIQWFL